MLKRISVLVFIMALLLSVANVYSFSGQVYLSRAKQFYYQNKFFLAKELFEKVLRKEPVKFNAEACLMLGNIYDQHGKFKLAISLYQRGLELSEQSKKFKFYLNLSQAYRHAKNYVKSLETLNKVIVHSDKHPEVFLFLGLAYFGLRNKQEVINNWETYLVKVPYGEQSDTVRKALKWLRNPKFKWPEEIERERRQAALRRQRAAAAAVAAQRRRIAELERQRRLQQERARRFLAELKRKREQERLRRLQQQRDEVNIRTRRINPRDRGREEGRRFDEIER